MSYSSQITSTSKRLRRLRCLAFVLLVFTDLRLAAQSIETSFGSPGLVATDPASVFSVSQMGCAFAFDHPVELGRNLAVPHGSQITGWTLRYFDASTADVVAQIRQYDGLGPGSTISETSSSGASGNGEQTVAVDHVVDNAGHALRVEIELPATPLVRSCMVVVRYQFEPFELIFEDGFETGDTSSWSTTIR